jgi:transposase-like protein
MLQLKWTPNLGQVFKWDTVQRNGLQMTESKKRRVHPPEFKAKVGLEALGGMKNINQIAQEYGVHPIQVGQWKREIQAQAKVFLRASVDLSQFQQRVRLTGSTARSGA